MQSLREEQWKEFLKLLRIAVEENREEEFLKLFLTLDERESLGLRIKIIDELLEKKHPQREIQQRLHTSAATITRGSNMLKTMDDEFITWLKSAREID